LKIDDNEEMMNDSFNQSMTIFNNGHGANNSITA